MKIQSQNLIKKKGAVPVGRAPVYLNLSLVRWVWLGSDDVVRHPARQSAPHLARHEALDLANADAELEELLHRLVKTGPLVAVLVVAGFEERPSAAALLLKLLRQLVQHGYDLGLVALQTLGVKPDVPDDALGLDVLAGVLAISEQAIHEDRVDLLCVETCRRAHSTVLLSRYCFIPSRHIAQISCHPSIPDHKSQEAASAASWECLKNFSFLLLTESGISFCPKNSVQFGRRAARSAPRGIDFSYVVPPPRIELGSRAPEARVLSVELRGPYYAPVYTGAPKGRRCIIQR